MTEPNETLGNDAPSEGDLPETVESPAPAQESQDSPSEQGEEYWKRKYLDAKQAEERANDLKRELETIKSRLPQSPAAPSTQDGTEFTPSDEARLREMARDPENGFWARGQLKQLELAREAIKRQEALVGEYVDAEALREIPKEDRKAVLKEYQENRHLYGSPAVAHEALKSRKYESELEKLRRENEQLRKRPDKDVLEAPPTGSAGREISARERQREWTEEQFDAETERLRNTKGELAAMKFLETAPSKWRR